MAVLLREAAHVRGPMGESQPAGVRWMGQPTQNMTGAIIITLGTVAAFGYSTLVTIAPNFVPDGGA